MKPVATAASMFLLLWHVYGGMPSYAQSFPLGPEIGTIVTPRATLPAWQNYPSGLLRSKGPQIGEVNSDETYEVIGKKVVSQLFFGGDQYYLHLRPNGEQDSFWVFQGREKGDLCPNLIECNEENSEKCGCNE